MDTALARFVRRAIDALPGGSIGRLRRLERDFKRVEAAYYDARKHVYQLERDMRRMMQNVPMPPCYAKSDVGLSDTEMSVFVRTFIRFDNLTIVTKDPCTKLIEIGDRTHYILRDHARALSQDAAKQLEHHILEQTLAKHGVAKQPSGLKTKTDAF